MNGSEGVEVAPRPAVETKCVMRPCSVAEPDDRLIAQSPPPPTRIAEAGPLGVQGGVDPVMPVHHLHQHEHVEGVADKEARAVVEHLATQHGQLFSFLHQEVESLKKDMVRGQFVEEVVNWAEKVQTEMERQGHEITSLQEEMQVSTTELSAEVAKYKGDLNCDLV